jgi:hypothetical protein
LEAKAGARRPSLVHEARPLCLRPAEEEASHRDGEKANKQTTTVCKPPADERSLQNLDFARRRQNQELDEEVSAQQLQNKAQEQQRQLHNSKFSPTESCGVSSQMKRKQFDEMTFSMTYLVSLESFCRHSLFFLSPPPILQVLLQLRVTMLLKHPQILLSGGGSSSRRKTRLIRQEIHRFWRYSFEADSLQIAQMFPSSNGISSM